MKAGNAFYRNALDLPEIVPVFPLAGALLLPGGRLPLNIFEPRYISMIDHALGGSRLIGMVQPRFDRDNPEAFRPDLCDVGCIGRLVSFAETGNGRYLVTLHGVCRFSCGEELQAATLFRQCRITPFDADFGEDRTAHNIDRAGLMRVMRAYMEANHLETDWESAQRADVAAVVNAFAMMAPYEPAEKQALLEAPDLKARAETLVALTEMKLREGTGGGRNLQ